MAKVGEAELKNQIKAGDFSNVYMIYGEEDYLKELEESNKAKIEEYEIWKYLKEKVTTALSS